ncbi:hypothetical protein [Sulfurimonas sp.]
MNNNGFDSITQTGAGRYSNLQRNQVYRDRDNFKNNDTFSSKNPWKNDDVYGSKNPWKKDNPYASNNVYADDGTQKERPKYRRFSDLKILNELMLHMSNNTLDEDSRIEILSQGEKGEIKNLLAARIFKISLVPALASLALAVVIVFTDNLLISLFAYMVYMGILVRTFFYPAKLYYENIKYKTTRPAKIFFEEMDYWYKISVVKIYVYLTIVSIILFVASFYQDEIIDAALGLFTKSSVGLGTDAITSYLSTVEFSFGLKFLAFYNILILVVYAKFVNKEKTQAELELRSRMKKIRNETISRVEQIQRDKNNLE